MRRQLSCIVRSVFKAFAGTLSPYVYLPTVNVPTIELEYGLVHV
jgi:hypothetical protein